MPGWYFTEKSLIKYGPLAADERSMDKLQDRRIDTRLLCADLVELVWSEADGQEHRRVGNLEDISLCGLCLQLEAPVPVGTRMRVLYGDGELTGIVRYTVLRDHAYFLGVQLDADARWSSQHFVPQHLLDPRELMHRVFTRRRSSAASPLIH